MGIFSFFKKREFFSAADKAQIVDAIRAAEKETSGEIRIYVESKNPFMDPLERAVEIFFQFKMQNTAHRNAVRVRLVPSEGNGDTAKGAPADWNVEFSGRLKNQDLHWDLQFQPFVNETMTPIEDASVNWPTPYTTVARLTLPKQDTSADPGFAQTVESAVFDPWQALAAHRPLGEVMRARKVVYFASQTERGAT